MPTKTLTPTQKAAEAFRKATKLSTILSLALADIKKAERAKDCKIDMKRWRLTKDNSPDEMCHVCLAGAVMRARFPTRTVRYGQVTPWEFIGKDYALRAKFFALDDLRSGRVVNAASEMGIDGVSYLMDRSICHYDDNPAKWHKEMHALLTDLKKAKL